jgi:hypothetical protein
MPDDSQLAICFRLFLDISRLIKSGGNYIATTLKDGAGKILKTAPEGTNDVSLKKTLKLTIRQNFND